MEVGTLTWPLVQMGWGLLAAGQLPQYKPGAQSVLAEHDSRSWQFPVEQAEEALKKAVMKKNNSRR